MKGPIKPSEVGQHKIKIFPEFVFEVFNDLIGKHFNNGYATIKQDEIITKLMSCGGLTRADVFSNHYLDVEDAYRDAGWKVIYDRPAYNENYPATFEFSKKAHREDD